MNGKKFLSLLAIGVAISLSVPHPVKAGGAAPTTTSSVRGIVHFDGKVPAAKPISMAADPVCAKQHPSPVMAQEIMADSKGNLQNAILFPRDWAIRSSIHRASPRSWSRKDACTSPT